MVRNRALKSWFVRMPLRPLIKFCVLYFVKLGFLDGYSGLAYCQLQAMYEFQICLKIRELKTGSAE